MTANTTHRLISNRSILIWSVLVIVAITAIALKLQFTMDLGFFLPAPSNVQQEVLTDSLGQGPGSRLIFVSFMADSPAAAAESGIQLKSELDQSGLFTRILNGQEQPGIATLPKIVLKNRYLLSDTDFSAAGLRAAMDDRLADIAILSSEDFLDLVGIDPFLSSIKTLERLSPASARHPGAWYSAAEQRGFLLAETLAPSFELGAQQAVVAAIEGAGLRLGMRGLQMHGMGIYGVELQDIIRSEAQFRSLLATGVILLVLLLAYRSFRVCFIAFLPLLLGALIGTGVLAVLFDSVHGITLAFGFTLFGVAIDYPLHLLSHSRDGFLQQRFDAIWPTLRLGAVSTLLGYLAIAAGGSQGLAQLGVFSAVGVLTAVLATRSLVPALIGRRLSAPAIESENPCAAPDLRHRYWLIVLTIGIALLVPQTTNFWSDDLSALSPVAPETLKKDHQLRQAMGAPDVRWLAVLKADTSESVLKQTEQLERLLANAVSQGELDTWQAVTAVLPSRSVQQQRRNVIPDEADLRANLAEALIGLPFNMNAFEGFLNDAAEQKSRSQLIDASDFADSILQDFVSSKLYTDGSSWFSLVILTGLKNPGSLQTVLEKNNSSAFLVDLKNASIELVRSYRLRVLAMLTAACLLIALILLWRIGYGTRLIWLLGTLTASLILTLTATVLVQGAVSLFNLIAAILVAALGLDYALFFSRREQTTVGHRDSRHALATCAASTLAGFLILSGSSVPILKSIGVTVAAGVLINYLLARFGARVPENQA